MTVRALSRLFAWFRRDDGISAVEFALVLPVFITLMFGLFETGRAMQYASTVQWALDRASRLAVLDETASEGEIQTAMNAYLVSIGSPVIDIDMATDYGGLVPVMQVSAHYDHVLEGPFISTFTIGFDFESVVPLPEPGT